MESQQANAFRLQHISEIRKTINDEKRKRTHLSKKYHRCVKVVTIVDDVLAGFTMVLGSVGKLGITLLSTAAVTSPLIIAIEATALTAGIIRVAGRQANKRLSKKVEKHEKITVLAESTLSTISGYVSKALNDEKITDEEYSLIPSEHDKFREMKENIRANVKHSVEKRNKKFNAIFKKPSK